MKTNTSEVIAVTQKKVAKAPPDSGAYQWQMVPKRGRVLADLASPVIFEPENKKHRAAFAHFLVNQKWPTGVRFIEEWPHTSAVTTIQTKLTHYALRKEMAAIVAANDVLVKVSTKAVKPSNHKE